MKANVEIVITSEPSGNRVIVAGTDITHMVTDIYFSAYAEAKPQVRLSLVPEVVSLKADAADVDVSS